MFAGKDWINQMEQGLTACLLVCVSGGALALQPGEYAHVLTYERTLGGARPQSSLYLSMQSGATDSINANGLAAAPAITTPLYSSDKRRITLLNPLPVMYAAEGQGSEQGEEDEEVSVGKALGSALATLLVIGPYIYSAAQTIKDIGDLDICEDGGCADLDGLKELELDNIGKPGS